MLCSEGSQILRDLPLHNMYIGPKGVPAIQPTLCLGVTILLNALQWTFSMREHRIPFIHQIPQSLNENMVNSF